jgi:DNA repair exonuclease SbcCD nuclease subunit
MGRIAVLADVHVGNPRRLGGPMTAGLNERCRLAIDTLRAACGQAREQGCDALYVAGDLFDSVNPGPRVVSPVQTVLDESRVLGVPVYVMPGNHDAVSTERGDHALGPLGPVCFVVDRPSLSVPEHRGKSTGIQVVMVPHRSGPASGWLPGAIAGVRNEHPEWVTDGVPSTASLAPFRVLVLHLGITHQGTPGHLRSDPSAVDVALLDALCVEHGFRAVLAGHWHEAYDAALPCGATVVQIGALVPTGWSDQGTVNRGRMLLVSSGRPHISAVEVPGPRFVRVSGPDGLPDALEQREHAAAGSRLFVEWHAAPGETDFARQELRSAEARGDVARGTVVVSVEEAAGRAHRAAVAARSAATLTEALAAYVAEMDLPAGVDRKRVLSEARRYVGAGGSE